MIKTHTHTLFLSLSLSVCLSNSHIPHMLTAVQEQERQRLEALYGDRAKYIIRRKEMRERQVITSWQPKKKISREAMDELRELRQANPEWYTPSRLADRYGISLEAVVRILHSKFVKQERSNHNNNNNA